MKTQKNLGKASPGLMAGAGTILLATAAYFGLTLFAGGKKEAVKVEAVTADKVFAADTASAPPEVSANAQEAGSAGSAPAESAPVEATAAAETSTAETASTEVASTETSSPDPVAEASEAAGTAVIDTAASSGGNLSAEEARKIGEEVARQVAAQVAQQIVDEQLSKGGGSSVATGGLSADEARAIGREEGRKVAEEVARSVVASMPAGGGGGSSLTAEQAEQIGLAAGRRAAKQVAARTARDIVRKEMGGSTRVARSESAGSAGDTLSSGTMKVARGSSPSKVAVAANKEGGADALKAWWPATSGSDFGLVYAGQPKGEPAIALLFSNAPNAGAMGSAVKVYDANGQVVSGNWEAAANPRLVVFRGVKTGRYTVVVEPTLADSSGKPISQAVHGPVYVGT